MKTEDIKAALNLDEEWKRGRKVKDDKGNIIREFKNEDGYNLFVVTDPSDTNIINKNSLNGNIEVSTDELKDSFWPWAKYVFCYGVSDCSEDEDDIWVYITEYLYWKHEHCLSDWGGVIGYDLTDEINLCEAMEGCYELQDGADINQVIQKMRSMDCFVEDPEFTSYMDCTNFLEEGQCDMQGRDFNFVCGSCHTNKCFLTLGDDQDQFYLTIKGSKFYVEEEDEGAHEVTQEDVDRIKNIFVRNPNMNFEYLGDGDPFCCDCEEDEVLATVYYKDGTIDDSINNASNLAKKIYTGEVSLLSNNDQN